MNTMTLKRIWLMIGCTSLWMLVVGSVSVKAQSQNLNNLRLEHAKELLGKAFKTKTIKNEFTDEHWAQFVQESTRMFLPNKFKAQSEMISTAIIQASEKYRMDPVLILAVIQNESGFNPNRKGSVGEIGLMQVRPETAKWIAGVYKIKYEHSKDLYDPVLNIKIGAAFLDKLRNQFESESSLYLSAYNIGAKKVRKLVESNLKPKDYVVAVMKRYLAMYAGMKLNQDPIQQGKLAWTKVREITRTPARVALSKN